MKLQCILVGLCCCIPAFSGGLQAQSLKKQLQRADEAYRAGDFARADSLYNATLEEGAQPALADFNRGDALFRQERFEEAADAFDAAAQHSQDATERAEALYNLGNSKMKLRDFQGAVDAYKDALRNNPADHDARHNLMLAKKQLQQQQQQQQDQQQNQDQNQEQQEQNQDSNQEQQQNQDNQQEPGENQEEQNEQGSSGDQSKEGEEEKTPQEGQPNEGEQGDDDGEKKQQQARPFEISKEEAERMLEALNKREKSIQQKLRRKKSDGKAKDIEKDW